MEARRPGSAPALGWSRTAVSVLFLLGGAAFGGWAGRIPTIKGALGLSDAQWGLVILASPVGSLLGLLLVTRLVPRLGSRALAIPGALLLLLMTPIAAASPSPWVLAPLLLVQGLAGGLLFSPMNALAVLVERRYRRSILSSFHAWFSVGQLGGGLVGAAAGALRVPPTVQFVATNLLLAALLALTARALPRDRPPPGAQQARPGAGAARTRFLPPQLLLLAVITLLTGINEGGALQWSAQYAVSLGATIAVGALTLSCFSLAVGVSRFLGDRVVERIGRVPFVRLSACVSALGMGIALLSGTVPLALVGFALLGLGSGCISPTVFALGGNQPGVPAGRGVAVISLGEWPAFLLGPPVIGGLAELVTLRGALGLLVVSAVGIGLLATRVKEHRLQEA